MSDHVHNCIFQPYCGSYQPPNQRSHRHAHGNPDVLSLNRYSNK